MGSALNLSEFQSPHLYNNKGLTGRLYGAREMTTAIKHRVSVWFYQR